jgi:hypothetical protein
VPYHSRSSLNLDIFRPSLDGFRTTVRDMIGTTPRDIVEKEKRHM